MGLKECRKLMQNEESFKTRLISLQKVLDNTDTYPCKFVMWGFPRLEIKTKEELSGRINELQELLNLELTEEEE